MTIQNIVMVNSNFHMVKPVQGQVDNQIQLNTQIAEVTDLHTTARVKLNVTLKAHEGTDEFGFLELTYFAPVAFEEDDILDQQIVGKAITRQLIPMLASDANFFLAKACVPVMPPAIMLQILKNNQ